MREILAGNIFRYRKDLGMTQETLADRLGITFQAVSKWETGHTLPDTTLLPSLAQALNVCDELSRGEIDKAPKQMQLFYERPYSKEKHHRAHVTN